MNPFVPDTFDPPTVFVHPPFLLVPLAVEHNDADYDAWTSSMDHIRRTPGFAGRGWPREMTRQENLRDLAGHAADFASRQGFTYTVLDHGGATIGCVYLYPASEPGVDVEVRSWVRQDRSDLDVVVYDAVRRWIAVSWPFTTVDYAPRVASP
jgi:hypothetical protein